MESQVRSTLEAKARKRLNIPASQPLPQDVMDRIAETVHAATSANITRTMEADAADALRTYGDADRSTQFTDKVRLAKGLVDTLANNGDVNAIMAQRATMLAKKKASLTTAGFTADQAMQIILADIAARGH